MIKILKWEIWDSNPDILAQKNKAKYKRLEILKTLNISIEDIKNNDIKKDPIVSATASIFYLYRRGTQRGKSSEYSHYQALYWYNKSNKYVTIISQKIWLCEEPSKNTPKQESVITNQSLLPIGSSSAKALTHYNKLNNISDKFTMNGASIEGIFIKYEKNKQNIPKNINSAYIVTGINDIYKIKNLKTPEKIEKHIQEKVIPYIKLMCNDLISRWIKPIIHLPFSPNKRNTKTHIKILNEQLQKLANSYTPPITTYDGNKVQQYAKNNESHLTANGYQTLLANIIEETNKDILSQNFFTKTKQDVTNFRG